MNLFQWGDIALGLTLTSILLLSSLGFFLTEESLGRFRAVTLRINVRYFLVAPLTLVAIASTSITLYFTVSFMQWSIWSLVASFVANLIGHSASSVRTWQQVAVSYAFFSALGFYFLLNIPAMALYEEKWFRKGHADWPSIVRRSSVFGPLHCITLPFLPFSVGFALIIGGLVFGWEYKRNYDQLKITTTSARAQKEATLRSAALHSVYNYIAVTGMVVSLLGQLLI